MVSFLFGGDTNETPESIKRKREIANALLASRAPRNVGEGISSLGDGIVAAVMNSRANKAEKSGMESANAAFAPLAAMFSSGSSSGVAQELGATAPGGSPAVAGDMSSYRDAIASIESKGSGDYSAVGPTHPKMGRALGRYQVMESNIGPWSKAALGREVTPDEFLANPQIQDQIFDSQFKGYVDKYGPEGAAQAWFGGPGGVGKLDRKDSLGTSIAAYTDKFKNALGGTEVASLDPAAGMAPAAIQQQAPIQAPAQPGYVDPMVSAQPAAQPPQQMAQAGGRGGIMDALMAGGAGGTGQGTDYFPPAPAAPQPGELNMQAILGVVNNPFSNPGQRAVAEALIQQEQAKRQAILEQQLQQQDPLRQLQIEKGRLEVDAMRSPKPGYRTLSTEEKQSLGLNPNTAFQVDRDNKISQIGGNGVTINNEGTIPAGFKANRDEQGRVISVEPLPGSPAAAEAAAATEKKEMARNMQTGKADVVTQDIDRALSVMEGGVLPDTGAGAWLSAIPGTDAKKLSGLLDTIKANVSFDTLNQMRQSSPTGGALGSVTENELKLLQAAIGSIDQSQDPATLKDNLNRVWNMYQDTVHGAGNGPERRKLSFLEGQGAPSAGEVPMPEGMDASIWGAMTPEEKALWK